jgi:hypothetical protein
MTNETTEQIERTKTGTLVMASSKEPFTQRDARRDIEHKIGIVINCDRLPGYVNLNASCVYKITREYNQFKERKEAVVIQEPGATDKYLIWYNPIDVGGYNFIVGRENILDELERVGFREYARFLRGQEDLLEGLGKLARRN